MTDVLGVDVSKWQGQMNWQKCKSAGANFAFIRAGFSGSDGGGNFTDARFEENVTGADAVGLPKGYYWYFRPEYDVNAQADYFCNLIKDKPRKLPAVMDLESSGNLTPGVVTKRAGDFALRVNENINELPMLYSRAYWLNDNTVPDDLLKLLELWIARYTNKNKPWGNLLPWPDSPRVKPRDFDTWVFWQWSADGNGRGPEFGASSQSIDLNYFNGDMVAFNAYIGQAPPPTSHDHPDYEAEHENMNALLDKHDKDITAIIGQLQNQQTEIDKLQDQMSGINKATGDQ